MESTSPKRAGIDFSKVGVKNMSVTAIKTGHLSVLPSTVKKEEPIVKLPFNPLIFEPKKIVGTFSS